MLALISVWPLKNGVPPELAVTLKELAETVSAESGTLLYTVSLPRPNPLGSGGFPLEPPPEPIPLAEQKEVVFFEAYRDPSAFSAHVNGPAFTKFLKENIQYFQEEPDKPGWPRTTNTYLDPQSATVQKCFAESIG